MGYTLTLRDATGNDHQFRYEPKQSILLDEEGERVVHPMVCDGVSKSFKAVPFISPDRPGRKGDIEVLKIQLGFNCNYACAYCNQAMFSTFAGGIREDAVMFLRGLDDWFKPKDPDTLRIEFWGGEPFVYWAKLEVLIPALRKKFPAADLNIVTNGSLLDDQKADWIIEHRNQPCDQPRRPGPKNAESGRHSGRPGKSAGHSEPGPGGPRGIQLRFDPLECFAPGGA